MLSPFAPFDVPAVSFPTYILNILQSHDSLKPCLVILSAPTPFYLDVEYDVVPRYVVIINIYIQSYMFPGGLID